MCGSHEVRKMLRVKDDHAFSQYLWSLQGPRGIPEQCPINGHSMGFSASLCITWLN